MRDDWRRTTLGEIATSRLGKMLSKASKTGVDEYPYVRNANVQWNRLDLDDLSTMHFSDAERIEFDLRAGDVLICEGGEVGRAVLLDAGLPDVYFQKAIHRVRCGDAILPEFLMRYMEFLAQTGGLADYSTQLTIQHLTGEKLRTLPVDVPPLGEQRRIVDVIRSFDKARLGARVAGACRTVAAAVIADLERQNPEYVNLADVVVTARAGATPSRKDPSNFGGSVSWLKSAEVDADLISRTEETITQRALERSSTWIMPAGTIVVAMYGATAGAVGYTAAPMACNQAVLGIRLDERRVAPRFMFHWLRSRRAQMRARRGGSTQPNLNKDLVLVERVPLLSLSQQHEIADLLDAALTLRDAAETVDLSFDRAHVALLVDLLSGEHEIPESYDALLEPAP